MVSAKWFGLVLALSCSTTVSAQNLLEATKAPDHVEPVAVTPAPTIPLNFEKRADILMARAWVQERDNKKGLAAQIRRSDPTVRRPVARYAPLCGNLHHCAAENGVGSSGVASRNRGANTGG